MTLVSRGGDTDTLSAIAGAAAGARFGASHLPERWVSETGEASELEALAGQLMPWQINAHPAISTFPPKRGYQ